MRQNFILTFAALVLAINLPTQDASAQVYSSDCLTNSIDVGTGIDHPSSAFYPYSTSSSTVQDRFWRVTMLPSNTLGLTAPFCAELVDPTLPSAPTWMTNTTSSRAINFEALCNTTNIGGASGFFANYNHGSGVVLNNALPIRFTRTFYVDATSPQSVTFNLSGWGDDIMFMRVDAAPGTPIYNNSTHANNIYYAANTSTTLTAMSVSVSKTLSPGVHTLDIDLYDISNGFVGINVAGTITTSGNALVANSCFGAADEQCNITTPTSDCSDVCYWKVQGNTILNGNNIFGTLSNDHVRIQTNSTDRGTFTNDGLLGWNTMAPTAYLHVDCNGHNQHPSDIRFENLEHNQEGDILIIDDQGYVWDTDIPVQEVFKMREYRAMYEGEKAKNDELRADLAALKERVDTYIGKDGSAAGNGNALYQNTPNPFNGKTTIEFNVVKMQKDAFIIIYDLSGKEISKKAISNTGKGSVTVGGDTLVPGMYVYALIIDGVAIDSKKMVLSK